MAIVGLGTDIVEINRFDKEPEKLERLARRVLTDNEYATYQKHNFPYRFLAKRFAAKEAAVKAIGNGIGNGVSFHHVEVVNNEMGKPELVFSGAMQTLCEQQGVTKSFVSISDEQNYATATVILESL
ncbi:MAG: holo-ACP synthase [Alteromonadaceae bacterium]|nr:holo-ACP synthase [Alteromonadaceae bacterium]